MMMIGSLSDYWTSPESENKLKSVVEIQPELTQRTIQESDVFAAACGQKEPKVCVRGLGLGPTPQSVGILGVKCYTPTRVQMQILAGQKTTSYLEATDRRIEQLEAELAQLVKDSPMSNPTPSLIPGAPPLRQPTRSSTIPSLLPATALAQQPPARNIDAHHFSHDDLIGKEVILYEVLRADQPVAKGVIISSNPSTVLAGQALGKQYCEVVIRVVLKRDAKLPRPYAGVQEMADAKDLSIA